MFRNFALAGAVCALMAPGFAADRTDKEILEDIKKNAEVDFNKLGIDTEEKATVEVKKRVARANELLAEFEKAHPASALVADARAETLKPLVLSAQMAKDDETVKAVVALADKLKGTAHAPAADLAVLQAELMRMVRGVNSIDAFREVWKKEGAGYLKKVEAALAAHPKDTKVADFLGNIQNLLSQLGEDKARKMILDSISKNLPEHELAKVAAREQAVGKEFVFKFTPVGSDKETSIAALRGKVVVIDFWATWCGPCVAEMPHMKELYAKYKEKGVEFVGVSLDRTEKALTDYCKTNDVKWLQVFGPSARKLSDDWGVEGIPTLYIIDKKGNLRSMSARGQLDKLIPELLDEK